MTLPPFSALRAFHAAARHSRFRDAAADIGVTESAISHQVRKLEDFLHQQLFERDGKGVTLTSEGQRYFDAVDPAFRRLEAATNAVLGESKRKKVALTLPPSLAVLWLIPNLSSIEEACPGVDLQLVTTARLTNLRREQIDLAIRNGHGTWDGLNAEFLLQESAFPVASPTYLESLLGEARAEIPCVKPKAELLAKARLIVNRYHGEEWAEWAGAHGLPVPDTSKALMLQGQEQVLEAAERGLGLAIGWRPMIDERLQQCRLLAPFGLPNPRETAYYLCTPADETPTAATRSVARWLHSLAARTMEQTSELT
ncbi:MAG: LysR substrate-binding domain-containing protein [Pseudomonadota bacterium]